MSTTEQNVKKITTRRNELRSRLKNLEDYRNDVITPVREKIRDQSKKNIFAGYYVYRIIAGVLVVGVMSLYLMGELLLRQSNVSFFTIYSRFISYGVVSTVVSIWLFNRYTKTLRQLYRRIFREEPIERQEVVKGFAESFALPRKIVVIESVVSLLGGLTPLIIMPIIRMLQGEPIGAQIGAVPPRDLVLSWWIGALFLTIASFLYSQYWTENVIVNLYDRGVRVSSTEAIRKRGKLFRRLFGLIMAIVITTMLIFTNISVDIIEFLPEDDRLTFFAKLGPVSLAVLIGTTCFLWFIVNSMQRSFDILSRKMSQVQDGNYAIDIVNFRDDEIGDLYGHFEFMLGSMNDVLDNLESTVEERTQRLQVINRRLSKYLSPQLYSKIYQDHDAESAALSYHRKKLTVFFSDIVNFTPMSEEMDPEELSRTLNQYLDEMARIALKWGGTIDKYIGDAVMIFFGDPEFTSDKDHAQRCIGMSLEMIESLKRLRRDWRAKGIGRDLKIRIGVNTGFCTVGNFGSENRMDYTALGRTVNMASRLESAAPHDGILISEATYLLIKDQYEAKAVAEVKLKGIDQPTKAYVILRKTDQAQAATNLSLPGFELDYDLSAVAPESLPQVKAQLKRAYLQVDRKLNPGQRT